MERLGQTMSALSVVALYFSSLSLVGSLFLSMTMTMNTGPVGSLCTHGSDFCLGLGPFVGWRVARFMQATFV